jgi:cell division protein FtsB
MPTTNLQHKARIAALYADKDSLAEQILKAQAKIEIYKRQRDDLEHKVDEISAAIIVENERAGAK